ncbi:hypothetical protein BC628DRAFT_247352 [Trametes gibbosa]|nr:hypothetical protein BC628DRAFT_247352 [Trametes gibbosa]
MYSLHEDPASKFWTRDGVLRQCNHVRLRCLQRCATVFSVYKFPAWDLGFANATSLCTFPVSQPSIGGSKTSRSEADLRMHYQAIGDHFPIRKHGLNPPPTLVRVAYAQYIRVDLDSRRPPTRARRSLGRLAALCRPHALCSSFWKSLCRGGARPHNCSGHPRSREALA